MMKAEPIQKKKGILDILYVLLFAAAVIMMPILAYEGYRYEQAKQEYENIPEISELPQKEELPVLDLPREEWPSKALFVEKARADYQSGQLRLIIPQLDIDDEIMNGTEISALKRGPGLYDVAQMPAKGDNNTSIAAHRAGYGRYGNLFRDIHTLKEGDMIYLTDKEWIYAYHYKETVITEPSDISVLYLQGYPCITLTSCNPIGKNYERIVVHGELQEIYPQNENFKFVRRDLTEPLE